MPINFDSNTLQAQRAQARTERKEATFALVRKCTALPTECEFCGECVAPATEVFGVRVDGVHECRKAVALAVAS